MFVLTARWPKKKVHFARFLRCDRDITSDITCTWSRCFWMSPILCVFTDKTTYKSHTWVTQHANWPSTQQAVNNASWELFVTTLSGGTITLDSQVGSIRPTESVDEITDRLSDIKIKPGRSSLAQPKSSSAAPLLAEWPSLQEHKRSHSKYTQNQLSNLHYVQTEIVHCSVSLCLLIWCLLLDQAQLTVAVSQQHINHISLDDKAINQLKEEVNKLLGSLESRWRNLSSTLPNNGPMIYSTGKYDLPSSQLHILTLTIYIRSSFLFYHWHYGHCCTNSHLSQDICYCHCQCKQEWWGFHYGALEHTSLLCLLWWW